MMNNSINFNHICSVCLKCLEDSDIVYALNAEDDFGKKMTFRGHEKCVVESNERMKELYNNGGCGADE